MKQINVMLEDEDHEKLKEFKNSRGLTWRQLLLSYIHYETSKAIKFNETTDKTKE